MSTEKPLEVSNLRQYPSVSVIIPMFNEELVAKTTVGVVFEVLGSLPNPDGHEVVCVNDGSADGTLSQLILLARQYPKLRVVNLSRNFGHQAALTAGMDHAGGDVLFVIDGDLQDDPWVLTRFIDEYRREPTWCTPSGYTGRSPGRCGLPMRCATDSCRACRVLRYR